MLLAIDSFPVERFGLITGSKCSVLFPLKGNGKKGQRTYAKTLANEKFFKFYDEVITWRTEHGKMAESWALMHYEQYIGDIEKGRFVQKGECGGTTDAERSDRGVDFKCPTSLGAWLDYLHNPLSKEQKNQCQMYMHLTGFDVWEIAAFLIETQFMTDNGLTYPVPEEKRMIITKVVKDPTWEMRLEEPLNYVIKERDKFFENLKAEFGVLPLRENI